MNGHIIRQHACRRKWLTGSYYQIFPAGAYLSALADEMGARVAEGDAGRAPPLRPS